MNNNIEQNKAQYNLDKQTCKISALSSRNVSKDNFLTREDILPAKGIQEKLLQSKDLKTLYEVVS